MSSPHEIALAFTAARRQARQLSDYPGAVPADLAGAYAIQEAAIALWPEAVAGWKVAAIRPEWRSRYDAPRLAGPIFRPRVLDARKAVPEAAVIAGGFAAVEAEFAFQLAHDLPARSEPYGEGDLVAAIGALHAAIEIAGSPLAALNDLGPGAVVSDFGNNAGLVIGPEVVGWRDRPPEALATAMRVDAETVGTGSAAAVPGGPLAALAFVADLLSRHGRGLAAGDWITTGATTGIHRVVPGCRVRAEFAGVGAVEAVVVAAQRLDTREGQMTVR